MADFPGQSVLPAVISVASRYAIGGMMRNTQTAGLFASAAWPGANRAIYVPFWLPTSFYLASMFCCNGATASGNIDLGVYTPDGALIVSKGATAQAGTSVPQILTMTATLSPGRYYMALSLSATAGTVFRFGAPVVNLGMIGVLQAASQNPLAANPTFATVASAYLPLFGIASITTY